MKCINKSLCESWNFYSWENVFLISFNIQGRSKILKTNCKILSQSTVRNKYVLLPASLPANENVRRLSVNHAEDCVFPARCFFAAEVCTRVCTPFANSESDIQRNVSRTTLRPTLSIIELRAKVVTPTSREWCDTNLRRFEPYLSATCHRPSDVTRFTNIPMVIVHLTDWSGRLDRNWSNSVGLQSRSIRLFSEMKKNSVVKQKVISDHVPFFLIEEKLFSVRKYEFMTFLTLLIDILLFVTSTSI